MEKYNQYYDPNFLISPDRLSSFLCETHAKVIDIRKRNEYEEGHLPNSVNLQREQLESSKYPYPTMRLERELLEQLFSDLGICSSDTLLLTDAREGYDSSRLWWMLHIYGFYKCHIADGGIHSQIEAGIMLTQKAYCWNKSCFQFENPKDYDLLAELEDIQMEDSGYTLVDVRDIKEYNGEVKVTGASKRGRVPGAWHIDYKEAIQTNHMIKSVKELQEIYSSLMNQPAIFYCQAGYRSAFTTMVLYKLLGMKAVKNYDGSWIEYSYYENTKKVCEGYDLIIVGGGSGGLSCLSKGLRRNYRMALVDNRPELGGECLHSGCVPSKALLHAAKENMPFSDAMNYVKKVKEKIGKKEKKEGFEEKGIEIFNSFAKLLDGQSVQLDNETILRGRYVIIATGSSPVIPNWEETQNVPVYTNETIFSISQLPKRLLVVGGGAIGCELGYAFSKLGSEVTLIEIKPRIMDSFDFETVVGYQKEMVDHMEILCDTVIKSITKEREVIVFAKEGYRRITTDAILIAAGRKPNVKGLGCEGLGILSETGYVQTDCFMKTKNDTIFAIGDINGESQFSHTASKEAETAIQYLEGKPQAMDYLQIPAVIYTDPQLYQIGYTEEKLKELNQEYIKSTIKLEEIDRFVCEGRNGTVKLLADPVTEMILGASAFGPYAGEWMHAVGLMYNLKISIREFSKVVVPYPTYSTALEGVFKKAVTQIDAYKQKEIGTNALDPDHLERIKLFVLDMDGTFYLGDKIIEGALDFMKKAFERGKRILFFTNNSSKRPTDYIVKLSKMNCLIEPEDIMTSGDVTIAYLKENYPDKNVYLVGTDVLQQQFLESGISLVEEDAAIVVVAFDTSLTYEKLQKACTFIRRGALFLATHMDINCPIENDYIPDCGAFCAAVSLSTGVEPVYLGKPSSVVVDIIMKHTGFKREDIAFVGDRLYTDVATGVDNGCTGILVLSGETQIKDIRQSKIRPHAIYTAIGDIFIV